MNSKLFKKLNEQIELIRFRNTEITESDKNAAEEKIIFGNGLKQIQENLEMADIFFSLNKDDDDLLFEQLFDILIDENHVLNENKERRIEQLRNLLLSKPDEYIKEKSRVEASVINTFSTFGMFAGAAVGGVGVSLRVDMTENDKKRYRFYKELIDNDSECRKYIHDVNVAAKQNPPDKKAAKIAYKNFKKRFSFLKVDKQYSKFKKEEKLKKKALKQKQN